MSQIPSSVLQLLCRPVLAAAFARRHLQLQIAFIPPAHGPLVQEPDQNGVQALRMDRRHHPHHHDLISKHLNVADGSDSGAGSISSQASSRMSSLRDLTRSPTPHSISGISLNSAGPEVAKSPRLVRSPVSLKSAPSKLHDVSDGIRPPTTKAYEKNINECKDHLVDENKDDYTRWVNYFHPDLIKEDIVAELADGAKLISLVNKLTGQQLLPEKGYSMHHQTLNVEKVFDCMRQIHVDVNNLSASDVVRGNRDAILAVVWALILKFSDGEIQDSDGLRAFLFQAESNHLQQNMARPVPLKHPVGILPSSLPHATVSPQEIDLPHLPLHELQKISNPKAASYFVPDTPDSGAFTASTEPEFVSNDIPMTKKSLQSNPFKPILKTSHPQQPLVPDRSINKLPEFERLKAKKQRMYEVKQKSRASLHKNQMLSYEFYSFPESKQIDDSSTKSFDKNVDQNRNVQFVRPVKEVALAKDINDNETEGNGSSDFITCIWNSSSPLRKALKVVLPLQVLMLLMVGMSFMVSNLDEIKCFDCLHENNYIKEFEAFYHPFPPAV